MSKSNWRRERDYQHCVRQWDVAGAASLPADWNWKRAVEQMGIRSQFFRQVRCVKYCQAVVNVAVQSAISLVHLVIYLRHQIRRPADNKRLHEKKQRLVLQALFQDN